jgi:hypothetical protein
MSFNFKLWENGARPKTREVVYVTISRECKVYLNERALEALGQPAAVGVMYDEQKRVIGLIPSAVERAHAYPLRPKYRGSLGRVFTAREFMRHHEIIPTDTLAFPHAYVSNDGILILDLKAAVRVPRGERLVTSK